MAALDKLKRIAMDEAQKQAEETAQEIDDEHKERQSPFRFSMCNIQPGEEIEYCNNPEIKCTIVDDKTVSYQGQIYSLGFGSAAHWQQILCRRSALFQVQGRMAE